jgi:hypothetical protein
VQIPPVATRVSTFSDNPAAFPPEPAPVLPAADLLTPFPPLFAAPPRRIEPSALELRIAAAAREPAPGDAAREAEAEAQRRLRTLRRELAAHQSYVVERALTGAWQGAVAGALLGGLALALRAALREDAQRRAA